MLIDFTLDQLQVLDQAIQQMPFRVAAPLIAHINAEIKKEKHHMDTPVLVTEVAPPQNNRQNQM